MSLSNLSGLDGILRRVLTTGQPIWVVHEPFLYFGVERRHALIVKRYLSTNEYIEHNAKAPHVDFGAGIGPGLQQLRRGKIKTSAESLQMAARCEEIAQAKVNDFDITSLADEYVLDLQVSMHDAVSMTIVQGTGDLTTKLSSLLLLELPVRDDIVKHLTAIYVFKQHVPMVICSDNIAQAANVRMVE